VTLPESPARLHFHSSDPRAASIRVSAMNRDIPNTHTHSGIKISIGRTFFSQPSVPTGVMAWFTVVRHSTKTARVDEDVSVGLWYTRDGLLSSIVLPSACASFLHPDFACPRRSLVPRPLACAKRLQEMASTRGFNGHLSTGVTETP